MVEQKHPYGDYEFNIALSNTFPDYEIRGPYRFDPTAYCRALRQRVRDGEISWEHANSLWRNYAASVDSIYVDMPKLAPCALSDASTFTPPFFDGPGGLSDPPAGGPLSMLDVPDAAAGIKPLDDPTLDPLAPPQNIDEIRASLRPWGGGGPPNPVIQAGRFYDVCPCIVKSKPKVYKVSEVVDRSEMQLNQLQFNVDFDLGIWLRDFFQPCKLEWWECPSKDYIIRDANRKAVGRVRQNRWTNVTKFFLKTKGARSWLDAPRLLEKLCKEGKQDGTTVPVTLWDLPGITPIRNYRRFLNIQINIIPFEVGPVVSVRILIIQSNNGRGRPNPGRVMDLGKDGKFRTLHYGGGLRGREAKLPSKIAKGPPKPDRKYIEIEK